MNICLVEIGEIKTFSYGIVILLQIIVNFIFIKIMYLSIDFTSFMKSL